MGRESETRVLFREMLREEWRLHARLFGGGRFGAFPAFVAVVAAGTAWLLVDTGTAAATVVAGLHALVFAFGLHTGTIGLVGRDALQNLLGDVTLLVFSARTLPLSQRRLLGVFLVKDVVYYAGLFLTPLSLALVPLVATGDLPAVAVPLAWLTLVWAFVLGLVVTFAAAALATRGRVGRLGLVAGAAAVGLAWSAGVDLVALSPYGVYAAPGLLPVAASLVATAALFTVGMVAYDATSSTPARTADSVYRAWHRRLPDPTGLTTKSLLDVARSSGGLWKVLFSGGVLFAVTAALVGLAETLTGVEPSVGVAYGAVLGLSAFTTYNWLTQFDDPGDYGIYPVTVADVFDAKRRAFVVLGVPVGLAYFGLAVAWQGARPAEALVGAALLVGLELYLFGLTTFLAGFSPNEFLFDTVLFAGFGAAVAVPLVPVLVVGLVMTPVSTPLLGGLVAAALALAGAGHLLYGRAVPKWTAAHRAGDA